MNKLVFCFFASTLKANFSEKVTNGGIIQLLCDSIVTPLKLETGDNFYNKPSVASRIINCREHGELPAILKEKANDKTVLASIDDYFRKNVARRIYPQKIDSVIAILKDAIIADDILSQEQKDHLCNLAAKETLGQFLAQLFLHVIGRKNSLSEEPPLPQEPAASKKEDQQMPQNIYNGPVFQNTTINGSVAVGDYSSPVTNLNYASAQEPSHPPVLLSNKFFNLFVMEGEEFKAGKFAIPSSNCLHIGTAQELYDKLTAFGQEETKLICSCPALFITACAPGMEHESNASAFFGRVASLITGQDIKVACVIDPNITIPVKALIEKRNELGIDFGGVGNEFSTQHWAVKQKNIFEIMADVIELPRSV